MRLNDLGREEIDIMRRVSGLRLDYLALGVMSNIWRAAQAFKVKMERSVLRSHDLSFAAFSTLFIVWIWEPIETRQIAVFQGVTRATVTSTITLLENRGLVLRRASKEDRRLVLVELRREGKSLIEALFPKFNRMERSIACSLSKSEQEELARLLRKLLARIRTDEELEPEVGRVNGKSLLHRRPGKL